MENKITINGVDIPLEKVCKECGGSGEIKLYCNWYDEPQHSTCQSCHGTGKQPIYYTPQQIEELTGEKLPDDTAVWVISWIEFDKNKALRDEVYVCLDKLSEGVKFYNPSKLIFIAFPFQPAPPSDYRVEEQS